jgi:hypothetical protein
VEKRRENSSPDVRSELHYSQKQPHKNRKPIITLEKKKKKLSSRYYSRITLHPKTTHTIVLHRFNTGPPSQLISHQ